MAVLDEIYLRFCRGDVDLFYQDLYPGLLLYATRVLGPELAYMAEDCVQDAVGVSYDHRKELGGEKQWYTYILRSIRNRAIDITRRNDLRHKFSESQEIEAVTPDVSTVYIEHETLQRLYDAINSLPEKYRQIFDLSFEQGLKNAEVAEMLDIAEVSVKKRKARLIELLRERLGGNVDDATIILFLYGMASHAV